VTEQTHSSSSTSLAGTPHGHIWPIKHSSRFFLLNPYTGWCISPPLTDICPGRAPFHAPCCPNMLIYNTPGELVVNIKVDSVKEPKRKI